LHLYSALNDDDGSLCVTERFRALVAQLQAQHPSLRVDIEAELAYYREVRGEVLGMTADTVEFMRQALLQNKSVLVEGESGVGG
jgi:adenylosuccinate synthase